MKKIRTIIMIVMLLAEVVPRGVLHAAETGKHSFKPTEGYVPDETTAIAIAVAVWLPIYGKERIEEKKPYKAILKDGIWYVRGSIPAGWKGGVPEAELSKDNGRILRISHGK
jgi:hypothetical protein